MKRFSRIFAAAMLLMLVLAAVAAVTQIDLTTQVKGTLPVANGGTGVTSSTGSTNVVLSGSPTITTPTISGDIGGNLGIGSFALTTTIANDTTTGTTANLLVKLSSAAPSKAIITGTGDTGGILGICLGNCGTSGSATITMHGQAGCIADNSITAGDYIVEGTTTAGRCKSIGASPVTANQIIGRSLTTTSAASTATILLYGPDIPDTASSVNFSDDETPSGSINGSNTSFTLAHSPNPAGSLALFKNGQKLEPGGADYTLSGATITMTNAPKTGDVLTTGTYRF